MPGFNDNEATARRIAETFDDRRVRHFYDPMPSHRAGKAFADGMLNSGAGPAWDIYFFYDEQAEWKTKPPDPAAWMHQLGGSRRADPKHFQSGDGLIKQLHLATHKVTGVMCGR